MILTVNYEEMLSLRVGARAVLNDGPMGGVAVAAPPEDRARVAALPPLDGDLSVGTLVELGPLEEGVETIVNALRIAMDEEIVATHPASETAVASYFDYAHALSVLDRIQEMRGEMESVIEVVTGAPPDDQVAGTFVFPD
jgi:hypothetical protein